MIPIAFQASLLTLQMAVAALTAVASLMVAVAEDLVPFDSREKKTRIYGFWSFLRPQKDPSLKKVPLFAIIEKIEKLRRDPM